MASAASNYNKTLLQIQKLANNSAKTIQQLINQSNKEQMTFNSAEAEKSRSWQEKMSKSAHQMEVEDLKKAGLNPVLSANSGGAQSYTTSSASTQNDSGASASAAILSDQLGAMSNMESARMTSEATTLASEQQAKATRFAAQQSAAAQKYASDQAYKLGVYRANLNYQSEQEQRQTQRWIATHQTAGSWAGLVDKTLEQYGVRKGLKSVAKNLFQYRGNLKGSKNDFSNKGAVTEDNFKLSKNGRNNIINELRWSGMPTDKKFVDNYVKATYFGNHKSLRYCIKHSYFAKKQSGGGFW